MTRLIALVALLAPLSSLRAADWFQFRGPDGQGHSTATDLPTAWAPNKNVAWKRAVPGSGWSSPVVWRGKVFLTSAVPIDGSKDLSLRAVCLDGKTGEVAWDREVFRQEAKRAASIHGKNSHASPTPVAHDGRLYVHFGHEGTACLDAATGKPVWANRELRYAPVHGNGGSPVLVDGLLVFSTDGAFVREVVALDAKTGKVRWRTKRSGSALRRFSFSTPLVIEVGGAKQVVSPGSNVVGGYDPATGAELWRVAYDGYSVIPRPVYGHGLVFVSTGYDSPKVLAIKVGAGEPTVAWTLDKGAPNTPSMLLVGDELYMVSDGGLAGCVDARTGKVHWQKRLGGRGYSASPIAAGGKVWFLSEDGVGTVVAAGKQFRRLAQNRLGERTLASYAVIDGSLLIRTDAHLYRIGK